MSYVTIHESVSTNTSGVAYLGSAAKGAFNKCFQLVADLIVTVAAASNSPKLDVTIEQSLDGGTTWQAIGSGFAFTQITTSTSTGEVVTDGGDAFAGDLRLKWAITGGASHGTITGIDPAGTQNKYTVTGKQTIPSDDNVTSWTVVEGAAGASLSVAVTGTDIVVTLAKDAGVQAALSTNLTGSNNDLTFTYRVVGTAGNSVHLVYDNSAAAAATTVATADNLTWTVTLRTAVTTASLTTALTGANNDLVYTAKTAGAAGNNVHIEYIDPGAAHALAVAVVGSVITVTLASSAAPAITSTASQVKAAIIASVPASALVSVALAGADTGAGVVTAMTDTALAGGDDKSIVATANEVRLALQRNATFNAIVATDFKSANTGAGVVTALTSTALSGGLAPAITSTTGQVITAVAAKAAANALVGVTNFAGNDGTGLCAAVAKGYLSNFGAEVYTFKVIGFGK